jgi:predicted DCC family thiol-disulfide oxidoreductase YuxK
MTRKRASEVTIVYDGQCPLCSHYVTALRIRENVERLYLLDARQHLELVARYRKRGMEINDGMIVVVDGRDYTGAEAVRILATLSNGRVLGNAVLSSSVLARVFYPVMRVGRRILLYMLGRDQIAG